MLVLSRKKQQSVVVECSDGFERQLKVTVLGIRGGKVKLGFDVKDDVPVSRLKVQQRIHAGAQPNSPSSGPAAPKEEMNRWDDDGGGKAGSLSTQVPILDRVVGRINGQ